MLSVIDRPSRYRRFRTYDFEWVPGTLKLRVASVYDGQRCKSYRSIADFVAGEFTHANRGKWFYAHSGGSHDLQFIIEYIYGRILDGDRSWSYDLKFSGSSAIIAKIKRGKHVWLLLDSLWLFRDKLANIAKSIGAEKGHNFQDGEDPDEDGITDEEYEQRREKRKDWFATVDYETLREYNQNDCVVLWDAIDRFENEILELGGELQMTIASTGMNLFRRRYLTDNIDAHDYVNECAIKAYAASRVEKFVDETEHSNYYDINSSFPNAMTTPCPGQFLGSYSTIPDSCSMYLADCEVEVPNMDVPPLAYRAKGRVFFPTGKWRQWFCAADLESLQEDGGKINRVYEVLRFDEFVDLKFYVNDIYDRRKATDDPFKKIVYKYLLNCLYGKFAEMTEKQSLQVNPAKVPLTKRDAEEMRMEQWLPGVWLQTIDRAVPHRLVPIATHITAVARRTLGKLLSICRDRHYCDTDGFSTKERLSTSDILGGLKLEKLIDYAHFGGQKLYMIEGHTPDGKPIRIFKGKGFNVRTATRYAELVEGKAIQMERMSRIREGGIAGFKTRAFRPQEMKLEKSFRFVSPWSRNFDAAKHVLPKRMPYPDGSTRPWHVSEIQDMLE